MNTPPPAERLRLFQSASSIRARVQEIADTLSDEFRGRNPLIIGLLSSSFIFLADLVRAMDCPSMDVEFWRVGSYGTGTESSGEVVEIWPLLAEVRGRHVILVDDIVGTGRTISFARTALRKLEPATITTVTLLQTLEGPASSTYVGFRCEPHFVVGYGLDLAGQFRNLPGLYFLDP